MVGFNDNQGLSSIAHLIFELFFSAAVSFILTSGLLPLLGLRVSAWTTARVTGVSTLAVFAVLDRVLVGVPRRRAAGVAVALNENPEFKLRPRVALVGDAETGMGGRAT
ncbi:hypothetical protein B0H16DRAFT_1528075 [Mycena metata]|uniref:Uncharacterized protein n=1 Tax=Mycena metata TaxID=1033252 RepID=A0AAD7NJH6_9AGAR|nr:hypothetical protein B0H16DRAFT_1528075 [Mycena metata]